MSHERRRASARLHVIVSGALIAAGLLTASCAGSVDVKEAVQVTDVTTGWFDAGVVDGKNKLVPSVTFRLRNTSDRDLSAVSVNVVFKFADNGEDRTDHGPRPERLHGATSPDSRGHAPEQPVS